MKKSLCIVSSILALSFSTLFASGLEASFADKNLWDGKTVPEEMVCSDYNFQAGSTPEIIVNNIPPYSRKLIVSFSDETFTKMGNGGHGVVAYTLDIGDSKVTLPSFVGETYDLPENFSLVKEHSGGQFGKEEGAYLAPCSGGKGNTYSVKIEAIDTHDKVLETTTLTLGKY